jgi:hypothetical protein
VPEQLLDALAQPCHNLKSSTMRMRVAAPIGTLRL